MNVQGLDEFLEYFDLKTCRYCKYEKASATYDRCCKCGSGGLDNFVVKPEIIQEIKELIKRNNNGTH